MTEDDARILNRLARIEGQVRGLQRMIEQGKDCEEILAQLAAIKSALDKVGHSPHQPPHEGLSRGRDGGPVSIRWP